MPNSEAHIFLDRLLSNVRFIHNKTKYKNIFAVVKANAYGHGITQIVDALEKSEIHGYCVSSEKEIMQVLKTGTQKPILMLSSFDKKSIKLLVNPQVRPSIHCIEDVIWIIKAAEILNTSLFVHLKIDTGMSRMGIKPSDLDKVIHEVNKSKVINIEGIWTHLSSADSDEKFTNKQLNTFNNCIKYLEENGIKPTYIHAANSAAILKSPESCFNSIRPGLLLYGVSPLLKKLSGLKSVMELSAPMILTKSVPKGTPIGYNQKFKTKKQTFIGIIQAGYADGVPTCLGNTGEVLIDNKIYPVCGNVSMDMITVDLGQNKLSGSQVCQIWGKPPLLIENLAEKYNILPYQFLVSVSSRVKRIYYD